MGSDRKSRFNPASVTIAGVIVVSLLALVAFVLTSPSASGYTTDGTPATMPAALEDPTLAALPPGEPVVVAVEPPATMRRTVTVRKGDTLLELLGRHRIAPAIGLKAIDALAKVFDPRRLKVGQEITLEFAAAGELMALRFRPSVERDVGARRLGDGGFAALTVEHTFERRAVRAGGVIDGSLYLTAVRAGIPDPIILKVIRIFSFDVDFQREIQPGDRFEVYFERFHDAAGRVAKDGAVLSAALTQKGGTRTYYRYTPTDDGFADYFDAKGASVKKTLMRTPVDGARLSSRFGRRRHPVLGYTRMHRGIDFAVPRGTPVMAAGRGRVEFAGWNGSFGRYLRIRHAGGYKTAYGHFTKFARGIRRGARVEQGRIVGYVGSTGRATGPHLHYEVHHNGRKVNPLSIRLPTGRELKGKELTLFQAALSTLQAAIARTPLETRLASAD